MFKVGDRIVHKENKNLVFTVTRAVTSFYIFRDDYGTSLVINEEYANRHYELYKEEKPMDKDTSYSFHVIAPYVEIDFEEITKDLSKSNPIAVVELDGENGWAGWVVVHNSLYRKHENVTGTSIQRIHYYCLNAVVIACKEKQAIKQWISHFKKVKKAIYSEAERNKGKVTVTVKSL